MHPIRSPQIKGGLQLQQKQQKAHIYMKAQQCPSQWYLGEGRHKDIKDFLGFNENESTTYSNLWDT